MKQDNHAATTQERDRLLKTLNAVLDAYESMVQYGFEASPTTNFHNVMDQAFASLGRTCKQEDEI